MRIILAGPYPSGTKEMFEALLPDHELAEAETQQQYDDMREGDMVIVRVLKTTEKTMENKKNLKAVIRWGAGYDSVDVNAADRKGILVATTPGANSYAVSELAVALMLAVGRKIVNQNHKTHSGTWDNRLYADEMTSLNKKTVGIIGGGNIGRSVARRVQAFGALTVYYDISRLSRETEEEYGIRYVPLEELIRISDVITLHVPLLESTRHMIGAEQFRQMKDHVIIINTARGGLIDDQLLAEALISGKVSGAGLDCVENENLSESPFLNMEQVIMTPHMGGTTNDLAHEMVPRIADQIRQYAKDGTLNHVVNLRRINHV